MRPAMLGINVFLTKSDELQGRFRIEDSEVLFWKSINLSRCTYMFLVEGVGFDAGALGPTSQLVFDVTTIKSLWENGSPELLGVHRVYVIPPLALRKTGCYMEPLSEIRISGGSESCPIYEFVTDTGRVFSSDEV
ncbi:MULTISPECIES: hypothetical protein [Pseudomonas]|uniref:hypothetical protein n=1 Tax=Pseudomonas TaxID=286 RepID=UPI001E461725|nr:MULTISPECIES: hypothetical protein [Pseudomonas]MCE0881708.1 hypothetical protein [Pseudomonas putida]MCE0966973.1 hypothetical protein [Pseudomonas sp. NMI4491_12]